MMRAPYAEIRFRTHDSSIMIAIHMKYCALHRLCIRRLIGSGNAGMQPNCIRRIGFWIHQAYRAWLNAVNPSTAPALPRRCP